MPRTATSDSLTKLLDHCSRPVYLVDDQRRIIYCNPALADWTALDRGRISGRVVEYHSEARHHADTSRDSSAPLVDLCPPPSAFFGETSRGTISCVAQDGGLKHRLADFIPLDVAPNQRTKGRRASDGTAGAVLVLLAGSDLSPQELAAQLTGDPSADELHRTIRRFRRAQAAAYAGDSLLGNSTAMQKVRAQVAAAAASGANSLVCGPPGSGRGHVARAIHYQACSDGLAKLVPLNCRLVNDDLLRRALDALRSPGGEPRHRPTLLLQELEYLPRPFQTQLLTALCQDELPARIVATLSNRHMARAVMGRPAIQEASIGTPTANDSSDDNSDEGKSARQVGPAALDPALIDVISTIAIYVPRLVERMEDLPILAQCFLEACNRGSPRQIGSIRREALDRLALYSWPGELAELRQVIAAAHRECASHEIETADLPAVIHHASQAASRATRHPERIVLDELLAKIEKEAIVRALAQAGGNKTEAAELLGMTRPRLYRRLVQLGFDNERTAEELDGPEFIERDSEEPPQ
jgi:transcriptional regulator with AAA-type ATPase domain